MAAKTHQQKFPKCYRLLEECAALSIVDHAFEGRRGHGGTHIVYRQMNRHELEVLLRAAIRRAGAEIVRYERSEMRSKPEDD